LLNKTNHLQHGRRRCFYLAIKIIQNIRRLRTLPVIAGEDYARSAAPAIRLQKCCKLNGMKRPMRGAITCNKLAPTLSPGDMGDAVKPSTVLVLNITKLRLRGCRNG